MSESVNLKSGNLEKLGGSFGNAWQKRYFMIKGNTLYWFKKSTDITQRGSLVLKGLKVKATTQKPFVIVIPTEKKEYQLRVPDKDEMDEWMTALRRSGANIELQEQYGAKRKSSVNIITNLKNSRGHSRKRSVSDTSIFKDLANNNGNNNNNNNTKNSSNDTSPFSSFKMDNNYNLITEGCPTENVKKTTPSRTSTTPSTTPSVTPSRTSTTSTPLRPATIDDIKTIPTITTVTPTSPIVPTNPIAYKLANPSCSKDSGDLSTFLASSKLSNSYDDDSLTYSSSSDIQVPTFVEYHESEDERVM